MKKLVSVLTAILLLFSCFVFTTSALVTTGQLSDNVNWSYDSETGKLVISGTGDIIDSYYRSPFEEYISICDVKSVIIENGITSIGDYAFKYFTSLTSITIPDSVTSIDEGAFSGCSGLTSITIPNSVTSIGDSAFFDCSGLTSVTIPDSVTSIGEDAFSNCQALSSISLSKNLERLGASSFRGCIRLEEITLPENLKKIGTGLFEDCIRLSKITVENPDCEISSKRTVFPEAATLYGYEGSTLEKYADDWNRKFVVIGTEEDDETVTPEGPHMHTYPAEWTVLTAATCSQDGLEIKYCDGCSAFLTNTVPALGHADNNGDNKCDTCSVILSIPEAPEEEPHTHTYPAEWTVITAATCSQDGLEIKCCYGCSAFLTNTVPALGHADNNGDNKCDTCSVILSIPEQPEKEPEKKDNVFSFLKEFLNNILDFFRTLFGIK